MFTFSQENVSIDAHTKHHQTAMIKNYIPQLKPPGGILQKYTCEDCGLLLGEVERKRL